MLYLTLYFLCTTVNANHLANILDLLHTLKHDQKQAQVQKLFNILDKPFEATAINQQIQESREKITEASRTLFKFLHNKQSQITATNFARLLIQPCYIPIAEQELKTVGIVKTHYELKIRTLNSDTPEKTDLLKHQTYDILNRIFVLWILSQQLLKISNDTYIELQHPAENLTISTWKEITQATDNTVWQSTNQVQQAQKIAQEAEEKLKNLQDLQATDKQIAQSKKLFELFFKFLSTQDLKHEIFAKYDFSGHLKLAINYLDLILQRFENQDKLAQDKMLQEVLALQTKFKEQMNHLYSNYFKKEFGGHFGNKFLVIKHKFAPKADGTIIHELSQDDAILLLTDLIAIWEIYQTLFTHSETPEKPHIIHLPYFNQRLSVQDWISTTSNVGFANPGQFNDELKNSLNTCFPEEIKGPSNLSLAIQNIKSGVKTAGSSIKEKAQTAKVVLKEHAQKTGGWIASTWQLIKDSTKKIVNAVTRKIEEEEDIL